MTQNSGKYFAKKAKIIQKVFLKVSKFYKKTDYFMNKSSKIPKYAPNTVCKICADLFELAHTKYALVRSRILINGLNSTLPSFKSINLSISSVAGLLDHVNPDVPQISFTFHLLSLYYRSLSDFLERGKITHHRSQSHSGSAFRVII